MFHAGNNQHKGNTAHPQVQIRIARRLFGFWTTLTPREPRRGLYHTGQGSINWFNSKTTSMPPHRCQSPT